MKAHATLKNLDSESCKPVIIRNLNRILDIRILDIDVERGILHFLCNGQLALDKVKKELSRIGFPVQQCDDETTNNAVHRAGNPPTIFFLSVKKGSLISLAVNKGNYQERNFSRKGNSINHVLPG
ncbi:hypothetical protein [Maribacter aestuarii]|uniref:hypothetical protein n=1 Tax=Maribacter aestuarii TaxID=1130723 RepID=UPI0025A5C082|nr:hypothetical protein [Maribacter aestuarii]